ncbi:hypothetical protein HDF22_003682 [Mucilaginibacter lappiensis]|uniref:Uncharacterized protein n=1 Tax=Mucilaginibacter lappiensis TaxID=354630 RepID=A0A841JNR5_9SPHI|nr:hypothetical protein [Mucilaginibacter lappiensis]
MNCLDKYEQKGGSNILKLFLSNLVGSYMIAQVIIKGLLFGKTC